MCLTQPIPEPLYRIAIRHGRNFSTYKSHFPALCEQVRSRYEDYRAESKQGLQEQLQHYLDNVYPPLSVRKISKKLKLNRRYLYINHPDIAKSLGQRYLSYLHNLRTAYQVNQQIRRVCDEEILSILERALTAEPPPSLNQLGSENKHSSRLFKRRFPGLCDLIKKRYQEHMIHLRAVKLENDCKQIAEAVKKLSMEGVYPSRSIIEMHTRRGILKHERCYSTWVTAIKKLTEAQTIKA
jgi:hypothetical protein